MRVVQTVDLRNRAREEAAEMVGCFKAGFGVEGVLDVGKRRFCVGNRVEEDGAEGRGRLIGVLWREELSA